MPANTELVTVMTVCIYRSAFSVWLSQADLNGNQASSNNGFLANSLRNVALVAVALLFLFSENRTVEVWNAEINRSFSESRIMADFLKSSALSDRTIAAFPATMGSAVLPYFKDLKFWYPGIRSFGTHMKWDKAQSDGEWIGQEVAINRIKQAFPNWKDEKTGPLLLLTEQLRVPEQNSYRLLFRTPGEVWGGAGETYFLYGPTGSKGTVN